ncbi:MAG: TolC family protein [Rickettsiales bacterium]|jgi:outer membrane protein|nr:TolC family protein [Rickettsiales bacterium]
MGVYSKVFKGFYANIPACAGMTALCAVLVLLTTTPAAEGGQMVSPAKGNNCQLPKGKMTLSEAMEIGLCRNLDTKAAYENVQAAKFQKYQAYSGYLPSVSGTTTRNWRYGSSGQEFIPGSGAGLSASWLLFDFGRRESDLSSAVATWNAAGFDYNSVIQTFVYDLISAYYNCLMVQADERANSELVKVAETAFNAASTKFKAGSVPKADVLRAETQLAQKKVDWQKSEVNVKIANAKLLAMLAFDTSQKLSLDDTAGEAVLAEQDVESLIDQAKNLRPDYKAAKENLKSAEYKLYSSYLRNLPSVSLNANKDWDLYADTSFSTISVRVSMPLFAGFANLNAARQAAAQRDQAEFREKAKGISVEREVWDAFHNYNTAVAVLESTKTLLKSAKESERVVAGMYKAGRATMLDWLTAQSELASAERQAIYAKYDVLVKKYALSLSIGEIG